MTGRYVLSAGGPEVSAASLDHRSAQLARVFRSAGLQVGDGVAILMENHVRFLEITWAAQRAGLYYTAINTHLTRAEARHILTDCGAKALVTSAALLDLASAISAGVGALRLRLATDGAAPGFDDYEHALAAQPGVALPDEEQGSDLLYSAGSTGTPKGIRLPLAGRPPLTPTPFDRLVATCFGLDASSIYLSPAPLYHAAPLRFCMSLLRAGGTVVVMDRFDAAGMLEAIEEHRVTHTQVVPTMLTRLLALGEERLGRADLGSLRCLIHAAAPCPPHVKQAAIDWLGPIVFEYYAGTERNGFVVASSQDWLRRPGTVGRAVMGDVHIAGDDGQELAAGEVGTVYFSGTPQFEYLGDAERTAQTRHPRGWTTMGDLGHLDDEGFLFLSERRADVVISGGVNVYPVEVENALTLHGLVADAAVFGTPHPDLGEAVTAVVQPAQWPPPPGLADALVAFCRSQIADFKRPRTIEFVRELPREPTGKLRKHLIRQEHVRHRDSPDRARS